MQGPRKHVLGMLILYVVHVEIIDSKRNFKIFSEYNFFTDENMLKRIHFDAHFIEWRVNDKQR